MPRKSIFKKEEMVSKALSFIRENGLNNLSARNFARYLNISTGPLFVAFKNFDELINLTVQKAKDYYKKNYYNVALKGSIPFKCIGMKYIQFAKEEPELFKIVFVNDNISKTTHFLPDLDDTSKETIDLTQNYYSIPKEKIKKLYNHLSVYCYGLAMLFVNKVAIFTMDDVDKMLSEIFIALMKE